MTFRTLALVLLATAGPAFAQDEGFRDGRLRYVEPGVTLQRGSETGAEEATPNLPFLPGDRLWTDRSGRAELQLADGTLLHLDSRSKLDYILHDEGRDERVVLRLWGGSLALRTSDARDAAAVEIETPDGLVVALDRGGYRVDVDRGETRLSVYDGQATLEAARQQVSVGAGERAYARRGEAPEGPRRFDARADDDFTRWVEDRRRRDAWAGDSRRYLPEEISEYGPELEAHGSWHFVSDAGYVWRPYVNADWAPYVDGRWAWTAYGWTWVSYEPWGWAPFHYGRWGYTANVGWYWMPGHVWGPAWVSWATGGDYIGWCPLGRGDRPVVVVDTAVPRRGVGYGRAINVTGWSYVRRADLGARDVARRRVDAARVDPSEVRVAESARVRPTRDLKLVETPAAAPRNVHIRPSPADTVPEMRTDPQTVIPAPMARRRRDVERPPRYDRQGEGAVSADDNEPRARGRDADQATASPGARPGREPEATGRPVRDPEAARRPSAREPARRNEPAPYDREPRAQGDRPQGDRAQSDRDAARRRDDAPPPREDGRQGESRPQGQGDREVLQKLFDPLSHPRPAHDPEESRPPRGDSGARSRGDGSTRTSAPPPQTAPPRTAPPPQAAPPRTTPPPRPAPPPPPPKPDEKRRQPH
jgi:hypothetical protein